MKTDVDGVNGWDRAGRTGWNPEKGVIMDR